jgi:hypothetical protein
MKGLPKVLLLFVPVVCYFALGVFGPWYDGVVFQSLVLTLCLGVRYAQEGWQGLRKDISFVLPFLFTLLIMGLILDAAAVGGRTDWTLDSLRKAIIFPNSLWSVHGAVSALSLTDLVLLPIPLSWRRNLIIAHAMVHRSRPILERLWWFTLKDPHLAEGKWLPRTSRRLAVLLVAALTAITAQTQAVLRLYDARRAFMEEKS